MLRPKLPAVGDKVTLFGIEAWVTNVDPQGDWMWEIELSSVSAIGAAEMWTIEIPTDFHTTDGMQVTCDDVVVAVVADDKTAEAPFSEDSDRECELCGERLGDPMTSEWGEYWDSGDLTNRLAHASCMLEHDITPA